MSDSTQRFGADPAPSLSSILAEVERIESSGRTFDSQIRISILRNFTIEGILPLLKFHCYHAGLQPIVTVGDYDNVRQEILNRVSHVYIDHPDIVLLSLVLEQFDNDYVRGDWTSDAAADSLVGLLEDLASRVTSTIVVNTFIPPLHHQMELGYENPDAGKRSQVRLLNAAIRDFASAHAPQFHVVDWERLIGISGEAKAIDYRFWYMSRAPFKKEFLDLYAREIASVACALKGKSKKCLILDCDNTLWGGIVGEDGIEGIHLDTIEYPGRCYYEFQQSVVDLAARGIIIGLCSKNNEQDVWEVLDTHPHSLLKREHLTTWRLNWNNKAENLASIVRELNIGLESVVFVDDSGMECSLVKELLPEVTVCLVPDQAYDLPHFLLKSGLFISTPKSDEDKRRRELYKDEERRREVQRQFENIDDYLASLGLTATIHRATSSELTRVAQLIGKTNQFNLTTRRHSEVEVRRFSSDPEYAIFTMSASDRFGDLGLVGVLIIKRNGSRGAIDTLLMSCRALGRRLEFAFVDHCIGCLGPLWNVELWEAEYRPTSKNRQVENFWESVGFTLIEESPDGRFYSVAAEQRPRSSVGFIKILSE